LEQANKQGHGQISIPLSFADTHIEIVHLENNATGQEFCHWVDMFRDRGIITKFTSFLSMNHLGSLSEKILEALEAMEKDESLEFDLKIRLLGGDVTRLYSLQQKLFDLVFFSFLCLWLIVCMFDCSFICFR
jgi:hypothetical protein